MLGELAAENEELRSKLDEELTAKMELQAVIDEANKEAIFDQVSEGLVATQVEKLRTMVEGLEFNNEENYKKKLEIIKEKYFAVGKSTGSTQLTEATEGLEESAPVPGHMAKYVAAISKTSK